MQYNLIHRHLQASRIYDFFTVRIVALGGVCTSFPYSEARQNLHRITMKTAFHAQNRLPCLDCNLKPLQIQVASLIPILQESELRTTVISPFEAQVRPVSGDEATSGIRAPPNAVVRMSGCCCGVPQEEIILANIPPFSSPPAAPIPLHEMVTEQNEREQQSWLRRVAASKFFPSLLPLQAPKNPSALCTTAQFCSWVDK